MMKNNNTYNKIVTIIILISIVILFAVIGALPSINDYQSRNRVYPDMQENIDEILSANIHLVDIAENQDGTAYGAGASGVIIGRESDRYYALTACHVVYNHDEVDCWVVISPDDPTIREYMKSDGYNGLEDYYKQFPKLKIEFTSPKYDLALVSFSSKKDLCVANISDKNPDKGDRIAVVSIFEGQNFASTYGVVQSNHLELFKADSDTLPETQILKHNAYEAPGNSGSGVFNEDMQLVGINIGGGTDVFKRFKYGVMTPAEQIREFLHLTDLMQIDTE